MRNRLYCHALEVTNAKRGDHSQWWVLNIYWSANGGRREALRRMKLLRRLNMHTKVRYRLRRYGP